MNHKSEKGAFIEWLLMFLAISVVIFGILIPKSGKNLFVGAPIGGSWTLGEPASSQEQSETIVGGTVVGTPTSAYHRSIELGPGSAASATNPDLEYVTIRNVGSAPVDITGWSLKNAKDQRFIETGGQLRSYAAETALIPRAALILSPFGGSQMQDVILQPGETAYIATGQISSKTPYSVTSFKTNKCTGYLGDLPKYYTFAPSLPRQCVRPDREPGLASQTPQCQDFANRMQSCHKPEFESVVNGELCRDCVDGFDGLDDSCIAFLKEHFSYPGCVASHLSDADFLGSEWRIYLGRPWEMWAASHETISLYDASGNLVATYTY